jgi:hypothetical protein
MRHSTVPPVSNGDSCRSSRTEWPATSTRTHSTDCVTSSFPLRQSHGPWSRRGGVVSVSANDEHVGGRCHGRHHRAVAKGGHPCDHHLLAPEQVADGAEDQHQASVASANDRDRDALRSETGVADFAAGLTATVIVTADHGRRRETSVPPTDSARAGVGYEARGRSAARVACTRSYAVRPVSVSSSISRSSRGTRIDCCTNVRR